MTETEHVKLGAYHTLELEPQRAFTLEKASWDSLDIERIKQACDPAASADLAAVLITVRSPHSMLLEGGNQDMATACTMTFMPSLVALQCTAWLAQGQLRHPGCVGDQEIVPQEGLANVCLVGSSTTILKAKVEANLPRKRGAAAAGYDKALESFFNKVS